MPKERTTRQRRITARRRALVGGALALVVLAVIALVTVKLVAGRGSGSIAGVEHFSGLSRAHVQADVHYPQTPPVGGPHSPEWLNCGVYRYPVRSEYAVHSLEHGAVWITYRPDLPAAQVSTLTRLAEGSPYTILSPYPGLPAPVVAVAWGLRLELPSANDPRLEAFVKRYRQGPQTPEPGAPCTGGVG